MPALDSPNVTSKGVRRALERLPEMRNGIVNIESSVAGYCKDRHSDHYGKVWALLDTQNGVVQYAGYTDALRRSSIPMGCNDIDSMRAESISTKSKLGYRDLDSADLPFYPWTEGADVAYRGSKRKSRCSKKTKDQCQSDDACVFKRGKYTTYKSGLKAGKIKSIVRKSHCAKKSKRKSAKKKSTKKKSTKKKSAKNKSAKKKSAKKATCNMTSQGKKRTRKSCKRHSKSCLWFKKTSKRPGHCRKRQSNDKKSTCNKKSKRQCLKSNKRCSYIEAKDGRKFCRSKRGKSSKK